MKTISAIEKELADDMKSIAERIQHWYDTKGVYTDLIEKLDEIDGLEVSGGWSLYVRAHGDGALLTKIIRAVRTSGWDTITEPPTANSSSWYATYTKPLEQGSVTVSFSSTVCRRVQVGVEVKEVPVYEVRCGDGADAEKSEGPY